MRRTLRAYRNNPIAPDAAKELLEYISTPENRGDLRVVYLSASGEKKDYLVKPVDIKAKPEGVWLVVEDFRDPKTRANDPAVKGQRAINLANIDTLAYVAANEPEAIVATTGAFRFLSPRFLRRTEVDGKTFTSPGHYLAYAGAAEKRKNSILEAGEGFEFPSESSTATLFRLEQNGEPSATAIKTVQQAMVNKFTDPALQRMLAATGNRPLAFDDSVYGVPLAPIIKVIRDLILSQGAQPGMLPSERLDVPEVSPISPQAKGFGIESEEDYEGRIRRVAARAVTETHPNAPEFVFPFGVRDLRSDEDPEVDALVYIKTQDVDYNLRILEECAIRLPYKVVSYSGNVDIAGQAADVGTWLAQHPTWKKIGISYKSGKHTGALDVFVTELIARITNRETWDFLQSANKFKQRDAAGNLFIPFDGTIVDVKKTASGVQVTLETDDTVERFTFVDRDAIPALREYKAFATTVYNEAENSLKDTAAVGAALGMDKVLVSRLTRLARDAKQLVYVEEQEGVTSEPTVMEIALRESGALTDDAPKRKLSYLDTKIQAAIERRDLASAPSTDAVQAAMMFVEGMKSAADTYSSMKGLLQDARRVYKDIRDAADRLSRQSGLTESGAFPLAHNMTIRLARLTALETSIDAKVADLWSRIRALGPLLSAGNEDQTLRGLREIQPTLSPQGSYAYRGYEPRELVAREVFVLPANKMPVGSVIGKEIMGEDRVLALSGVRDDSGPRRVENISADAILLIYQRNGVTCEPLQMKYLRFGKLVDGRSTLSAVVNSIIPSFVSRARNQAITAAMLSKDGQEEAIDELSEALDEENTNPDVDVVNYVEVCRKEAQKTYDDLVASGLPEDLAEKQASYKLPKFSSAPVMYYLLLNTDKGLVYTPDEVGVFPVGDTQARELLAQELFAQYTPAQVRKIAGLPRFMSDFPLDPQKCALLRPLGGKQAKAVFSKLVPLAEAGKAPPFSWQPSSYSTASTAREAMAAGRSLEFTSGQAAGRLAQQGVSIKSGQARVRGARTLDPSTPKTMGTLTGGMKVGQYKFGEGSIRVRGGARGAQEATEVRLAYSKPRLARYLDSLVDPFVRLEERDISTLNAKDAGMLRSQIRRKYGSEAEIADIADRYLRDQERRSRKDSGRYLKPEDDLQQRMENLELDIEAAEDEGNQEEVERLELAISALKDDLSKIQILDAIIAKGLAATKTAQREKKIEKAGGVGPGLQFVLKFGRQPTLNELQAMQEAALRGENPMSIFQKNNPSRYERSRRNPGFSDDDFEKMMEEFESVGETAPAPPPSAAKPPPPPPPSGRESRAYESFFGPREAAEETPSEQALARLRSTTQKAWKKFAEGLRSKGTKESLSSDLNAYVSKLMELQTAMDVRDTAVLQQTNGRNKLQELLRSEAAVDMRNVESVYTRTPRDEQGRIPEAARLAQAREIGLMTDYLGRPLAPPSPEEMRSKGLFDQVTGQTFDLSTPRIKELQAEVRQAQKRTIGPIGAPPAAMTQALNYTQLVEAARIAARSEKRREHGISLSSVSCKVMSSQQEVRRKLDRMAVNRVFNPKNFERMNPPSRAGSVLGNKAVRNNILLWFSADNTHAIFFVNNVGTCEFHDVDPTRLIESVLHYTVDWFNDPRESEDRQKYFVFIGRSGLPFVYLLWGFTFAMDPELEKMVAVQDTSGPRSVQELAARLWDLQILGGGGISGKDPKTYAKQYMRQFVAPYVTPSSARAEGFEDLGAFLTQDANNYAQALEQSGYAAARATSYDVLREGPRALRLTSAVSTMYDAQQAMKGLRTAVTLFYPPLYGENGQLLSDGDSLTGPEIEAQIKAYAKAMPAGGIFRIIDGSLWRTPVLRSAVTTPVYVGAASRDINRVPTPWALLRRELGKLGKKDVTVEVVLPGNLNPDLRGLIETAFSATVDLPEIDVVSGVRGDVYINLASNIAPGSTVVLWTDQDRANFEKTFGERAGGQAVVDALANNISIIKRVVVEAGVHREEGSPTEFRPGDPVELYNAVQDRLGMLIASAGTDFKLVFRQLGVPFALVEKVIANMKGTEPEDIAAALMVTLAEAYKIPPNQYFIYGGRSTKWGAPAVLNNRGRVSMNRRR
jgi:hypothetical protein